MRTARYDEATRSTRIGLRVPVQTLPILQHIMPAHAARDVVTNKDRITAFLAGQAHTKNGRPTKDERCVVVDMAAKGTKVTATLLALPEHVYHDLITNFSPETVVVLGVHNAPLFVIVEAADITSGKTITIAEIERSKVLFDLVVSKGAKGSK